jgi:hypothetical protein
LLAFYLKARPELSARGGDIITALCTHTIADAMLEEDIAERANSLWTWSLVAGRGGIDGDAIHVCKLL